jgi:hypothetical protein
VKAAGSTELSAVAGSIGRPVVTVRAGRRVGDGRRFSVGLAYSLRFEVVWICPGKQAACGLRISRQARRGRPGERMRETTDGFGVDQASRGLARRWRRENRRSRRVRCATERGARSEGRAQVSVRLRRTKGNHWIEQSLPNQRPGGVCAGRGLGGEAEVLKNGASTARMRLRFRRRSRRPGHRWRTRA